MVGPIDPSGDSGITVSVGPTRLSLRQFQDVFAELHKANSTTSKRFTKPFIVEYSEFKNLYQRLTHTISNYSPLSAQTKVSVTHLGDDFVEFDSFEQFLSYDIGHPQAITSVSLETDFALASPIDKTKLRTYNVEIVIFSGVGRVKEALEERDQRFGLFSGFFIFPFSAIVTIKYVDYSIAVGLMAVVDNWIKSLREEEESLVYKIFSNLNLVARALVHGFILIPSAVLIGIAISAFIPFQQSTVLIVFALLLSTVLWASNTTNQIITWLQNSSYTLKAHSQIKFNAGDSKLCNWFVKKRKNSLIFRLSVFTIALINSIIVSLLAKFIVNSVT